MPMYAPFRLTAWCALALAWCSCAPLGHVQESGPPITAQNPPDGMPQALVWAGGTEVTMGLDTGSGAAVMLFPETARALGGRVRGTGVVRETEIEVAFAHGGRPLPGPSYVAAIESPLANCDGLLGWPALRRYAWNLDLPEGNHQFAHQTPFAARSWRWLPIVRDANELTVLMQGIGPVFLDTGSPLAVCLSPRKWQEFRKSHPHIQPTVYWGYSPAAGGYYARECAYLSTFKLGPWEMKNILVGENFVTESAWGAPVPDYVMGMGALERRSVWIDGPSGRLYYSSPHGEIPRLLGLNQVGVTFIPRNGQYIAFVAEGSPAEKSGVTTGDILVTIDGRKPEDMFAIDQATTQPGISVELCLRRHGRLNLVRWTLGESLAPSPLTPPGDRMPQPGESTPRATAQGSDFFFGRESAPGEATGQETPTPTAATPAFSPVRGSEPAHSSKP